MGDRVLDVCCGSGDLAFLLSNKVASNGKVLSLSLCLVRITTDKLVYSE
jgi:demethylmenaquinone methyltransferase/2-methoxy-6-polyprenyl-1,4-benzoquinol methylase